MFAFSIGCAPALACEVTTATTGILLGSDYEMSKVGSGETKKPPLCTFCGKSTQAHSGL